MVTPARQTETHDIVISERGTAHLITPSDADEELSRIKRDISQGMRQAIRRKDVSLSALARQMRSSRTALLRLLKEDDKSMGLRFLARVVAALGARMSIRMIQRKKR